MSGEFDLIRRYFSAHSLSRSDVELGIGDDCAIVMPPPNTRIAISTDSLVAGTHFLATADPAWVAHKALVANLSDLAAMGAKPAWVSLALTLPDNNSTWLRQFSDAFFQLADHYQLQLIGGDTTQGPLSISLTVQGFLPLEQALCRHQAQVGDDIYVTGCLGDSRAGLELILTPPEQTSETTHWLEKRHYFTTPRVEIGQALLGYAHAAIDISDGLVADLGHILTRSQVGAELDVTLLPISSQLQQWLGDETLARQYALTSGEEYELCFTLPAHQKALIPELAKRFNTQITAIGKITAGAKLHLHQKQQPLHWSVTCYQHF